MKKCSVYGLYGRKASVMKKKECSVCGLYGRKASVKKKKERSVVSVVFMDVKPQ